MKNAKRTDTDKHTNIEADIKIINNRQIKTVIG